jgi:hypothetical protein
MRKYLLTLALVTAAASPALAATHKNIIRGDITTGSVYAYAAPESQVVVLGGQYLGRDPDPAVRLNLLREGNSAEAGGN